MPIIQANDLYFNIFPGGRHEPGAIRGCNKIHNEVENDDFTAVFGLKEVPAPGIPVRGMVQQGLI